MSSNGRTAVSGAVCEGSTPSTPAILAWSSSGLGRRPLKAEIGGSNPLQATTIVAGQAIAWPVLFSGQVAGIRTDEVEFRQEHHPPPFYQSRLLTPLSACFPQKLFHILIALVPFASTVISCDFIDVFLAFSRLGSCFESQQKNGLHSFIS